MLLGKFLQTGFGREAVPTGGNRQNLRLLGVAQVGQDGRIQLVPLLEADLVQAKADDEPLRVHFFGSLVGDLVGHNEGDGLCGNPQTLSDLFFRAADEASQNVSLEAIGVGHVLALEGRQQVLASAAVGTMMPRRLIDPETRLTPEIEVPHRVERFLGLQAQRLVVPATVAAAVVRQGPGDMESMAVAVPLILQEFDVFVSPIFLPKNG